MPPRWLPALFLIVSTAACSLTGGRAAGQQVKETRKMSGLTIATFPKQRAVLPGESTLVDTVAENRGAQPVEFPSQQGTSPFAYELLTEKDRTVRYRVSQLDQEARRTRDIAPEHYFPPEAINPNERLHREEDLAALHNEDFLPGKYLIRVVTPPEGPAELVSPLSPITVLVPKIESFSSEVSGNQNVLVTAYAHRREDGGVLILQREAGTDPRENIAFRRIQLEPGSKVQVAVAVDAVNAGNGRWFGWLRDGKFEVAAGWGNRMLARSKPMSIGSDAAILLSPGFQVDTGVGLFGFVEVSDATAKFRAVRATGQGLVPAFDAELTNAAQGLRNLRWNYRPDAGITVFWQDAAGHVYRRAYSVQGKPVDAAPIRTSGMTPLSWTVSPLGAPALQMVVRAPDGRLYFRIIDEREGRAPIALPELVDGGEPQEFGFCMTAEGASKVAMASAGKIHASTVTTAASAWQPVGEFKDPLFLHAFSPRGRTCWVEWFEKDVGLRRVVLP